MAKKSLTKAQFLAGHKFRISDMTLRTFQYLELDNGVPIIARIDKPSSAYEANIQDVTDKGFTAYASLLDTPVVITIKFSKTVLVTD